MSYRQTVWLTLCAVGVWILAAGCSKNIPPLSPPPDRALLKLSANRRDGAWNSCILRVAICDLDGHGPPTPVDMWTVPGAPARGSKLPTETNQRGSKVQWGTGYLVAPGHHTALFDPHSCGSSPGAGEYAGTALLVSPLIATTMAVQEARLKERVTLEFTAEAGKSYVVDCDRNSTPWLRITPEEER